MAQDVKTGTAAPSGAAFALQRFFASQEKASAWPVETIEIDASLPTLKETGRLRAIRHHASEALAAVELVAHDLAGPR